MSAEEGLRDLLREAGSAHYTDDRCLLSVNEVMRVLDHHRKEVGAYLYEAANTETKQAS